MDPLAGVLPPALLLDIEGTTTPVRFVHDVLFPFARADLRTFLERRGHEPDVREDIARLRAEHAAEGTHRSEWRDDTPAATLDSAEAYARFLMEGDRKSTGLKSLQGRIWEEGYHQGRLRGEVYPDVAPAFERWRRQGREIAIFSSGSVLAQRLLFGTTAAGDLTRHIRAFFDTTTGPKRDPPSYRRIAEALGQPPAQVLFLSDVEPELDAARGVGMLTALCVREGGPPPASSHPVVATFDGVCP